MRPLTAKERQRLIEAVEQAKQFQAEMLALRRGKPFPPSSAILEELRDQRTRDLRHASVAANWILVEEHSDRALALAAACARSAQRILAPPLLPMLHGKLAFAKWIGDY